MGLTKLIDRHFDMRSQPFIYAGIIASVLSPVVIFSCGQGCGQDSTNSQNSRPKTPAEAPEQPRQQKEDGALNLTGTVIGEVKDLSGTRYGYAFSIQSDAETPEIYSFVTYSSDGLLLDSRIGAGDKVTVCLERTRHSDSPRSFSKNSYYIADKDVTSVVKAKRNPLENLEEKTK